ncbi:MAG TPA: TlpA disulfide reductase family protein [Burkholderiaceae bacterium]|jgi:outer membrane receptor for ferrienterochelin and colicins
MKAIHCFVRRRFLGLACVVLGIQLSAAHAASAKPWDFTLPTLEGDRFVQASRLPGSVLINFWGRDCPPCVAELPRLQAFAQDQRDWTLMLVATDPPQDARVFLQRRGITLPVLKAGPSVVALMHRAGNRTGGLPFTVALRDGQICRVHEGELSEAALAELHAACGTERIGATR